jgi:hypothetical protein
MNNRNDSNNLISKESKRQIKLWEEAVLSHVPSREKYKILL